MKPQYTFDDEKIGTTDNGNRTVTSQLILRPHGITTADWYKLAAAICRTLNTHEAESNYRLLRAGEFRKMGDEIQSPDLGWIPVCEADLGQHNVNGHYVLPTRRRVDAP